jgi:hypothetical protein
MAELTCKMVRDITAKLKAAARQPDENGMIAFPVHPDSPLAIGDPVAIAIIEDARKRDGKAGYE